MPPKDGGRLLQWTSCTDEWKYSCTMFVSLYITLESFSRRSYPERRTIKPWIYDRRIKSSLKLTGSSRCYVRRHDTIGSVVAVFVWHAIARRQKAEVTPTCRESNPGQLLGRQLCSPLYHQWLYTVYCTKLPAPGCATDSCFAGGVVTEGWSDDPGSGDFFKASCVWHQCNVRRSLLTPSCFMCASQTLRVVVCF